MLGLAIELRRRGHEITFLCNGIFRELVEDQGLDFAEMGTEQEAEETIQNADLWHPRRSFAHIFHKAIRPHLETQYKTFATRFRQVGAIGIASCLGIGAR
jgi:UDP:flavonoid glycosyltransferase YjiC (YdhE family)